MTGCGLAIIGDLSPQESPMKLAAALSPFVLLSVAYMALTLYKNEVLLTLAR